MEDFDVIFPDIREQGGTRLRQCQLVMLRMLKIFDHLCRKHDIKYFLIGGSLLGAIRHKGFIPWDDDLDVGMTRNEYEKFERLAVPELPQSIFFQTPNTDSLYRKNSNVEARLRDKYSSYQLPDNSTNQWHQGLQVDIFVYDKAFLKHNFFVVTTNRILMSLNDNKKRAAILKWIARWVPLPMVYASNYQQRYGTMRLGTYMTQQEYNDLIKTPFEDMQVFVPRDYHKCLQRQYGDYMTPPPPEKRLGGHGTLADPFTPCNHKEILHWNSRKQVVV